LFKVPSFDVQSLYHTFPPFVESATEKLYAAPHTTPEQAMQIPQWVERGKRRKAERASARLKYTMTFLAAKHTGRQSIRALAEMVGMDHSTISIYIRRGSFSERAAKRIEEALGTEEVTARFLMEPLEEAQSSG
jgi:hypothetical protein